jgi:hypothetical protein
LSSAWFWRRHWVGCSAPGWLDRRISRLMSVVEEPHLAERRFLSVLTQTGIRRDETIDHADDCCGPGRRSPRTGIGPAARRALGPGQRQLGPTSGHQPDHAALTRQTSDWGKPPRPARQNSARSTPLSHAGGFHSGDVGGFRPLRPAQPASCGQITCGSSLWRPGG